MDQVESSLSKASRVHGTCVVPRTPNRYLSAWRVPAARRLSLVGVGCDDKHLSADSFQLQPHTVNPPAA